MKGSQFYVRILARKCTNKHTVTLYLRIKQEGVKGHILYSTGLKCLKKDFTPARQTVKDTGINELIQQERTRVYKSIFLLKEEKNSLNLQDIKKSLEVKKNYTTVNDIALKVIKDKKLTNKANTLGQIKSLYNNLLSITHLENEPIHTVTPIQVESALLRLKELYKPGSFKRCFGLLKAVFDKAFRMEVIKSNPFHYIDTKQILRKPNAEPKKMPDFYSLLNQINGSSKDCIYKHFARLQLLTGLSFCDAKNTTKESIIKHENNYFIVKERNKTKIQFLIPIDQDIIKLINENSFKPIAYMNYLRYLKKHYNISSHKLRHARARHLLSKGLPLEAVARILGHTSINMTMHYAPIHGRKLSREEVNKVLEW